MFPVHIINPFVHQQRQSHCQRFLPLGSCNNQRGFWPLTDTRCGNHQGTNPVFEQDDFPIAFLLQRLQDMHQTKHTERTGQENCQGSQMCDNQENCCSPGSNNQRKSAKSMCPFQAMGLNDLMNSHSTLCIPRATRQSSKWQDKVDCRGFESRNIKVKIDANAHELLIKAFKRESSENGVSTSCMRKKVVLPKNIDTKKITCKLSPNGILLVEAPFVDKENKNNKRVFVSELMSTMLPGWKEFLEQYADFDIDTLDKKNEEKEKVDGKSKDGDGENKNKNPVTELLSMMMPGLKEFLECHSGNQEMEKENITKKNEDKNSKDGVVKNEKEGVVAEKLEDDENSFTEQKSDLHSNNDAMCEMRVCENDNENVKDELTASQENMEENNEQLVDLENGKQHSEVFDDDGDVDDEASIRSDDSFILLSQMEEENNDEEEEIDSSKNTTRTINENLEEKDDEKAQESNGTDSVMKSEDTLAKRNESESHHMIDDSEIVINKPWEFRLEMPSYNPESLKVNFEESKRLLEISATQDLSSGKSASIVKTVHVGENVDVNGLKCSFRDGLLTVTAPYMNSLRTIPINM